jgi:uncharacterized protein YggE
MKKLILICGLLLGLESATFGQFAGGSMGGGFAGGGSIVREGTNFSLDPAQNERNKRLPSSSRYGSAPDDPTATYIEASVLMNVKADEYVAVFALAEQERTVAQADAKMNLSIMAFKNALKRMSINEADIFVDFVLQNRVYTFNIDTSAQRAKEELVGFELKKNVSIHFKNKLLLDQIASAAASLGIFDLVKVDYVVKDVAAIQAQLQAATARILKTKFDLYNQIGVKSLDVVQVVADSPSIYYPLVSYASYQAAGSNTISVPSDKYIIERALKTSTYYFKPLDGSGFDAMINPIIIEPVVQFTSYLKVKCKAPQAAETAKPAPQTFGFGGIR